MVTETTSQPSTDVVDYLSFYVNGKEIIERYPEPDWTLLWYLRNSKSNKYIYESHRIYF